MSAVKLTRHCEDASCQAELWDSFEDVWEMDNTPQALAARLKQHGVRHEADNRSVTRIKTFSLPCGHSGREVLEWLT